MKKALRVGAAILLVCAVTANGLWAGGSADAKPAAAKTKLVYWSMWNQTEPQGTVIEKAIRDFEKKNPGVAVEINWSGREIRKTLQPALDNGQQIDLWDEDFERVVKNWGSYALKLDDYVAKAYPATGGKTYENAVMKSILTQTRSFSKDGGLYAVTYQPFVFAFMYNKDHFKKAGITATPTTWVEFEAACAKLKAPMTPMSTPCSVIILPVRRATSGSSSSSRTRPTSCGTIPRFSRPPGILKTSRRRVISRRPSWPTNGPQVSRTLPPEPFRCT